MEFLNSATIVVVQCFLFIGSAWAHNDKLNNSESFKKNEKQETGTYQGEISNLQELLQPFELRHCLISVTRFETVDIVGLTSPILIRSFNSSPDVAKDLYGTIELNWSLDNIVSNGSRTSHCSSTEFFYTSVVKNDLTGMKSPYCTEIKLLLFSSATKPWKCELEVSLFLPIARFDEIYGPRLLEYPGPVEYYTRAPLVPKSYVLVEDDKSSISVNDRDLCERIIHGYRSRRQIIEAYDTSPPGNFLGSFLTRSLTHVKVRSIRSVHLNDNCKWRAKVTLQELQSIELSNYSQEGMHIWRNIYTSTGERKTYVYEIAQCVTTDIFQLATSKVSLDSRAYRIPKVQAYILQTILKNFSIQVNYWHLCENSNGNLTYHPNKDHRDYTYRRNMFVSYPYPLLSGPQTSMFYFNDTSSAIVFVTTATRGLSALAFSELIEVFQPAVWLYSFTIFIFSAIVVALLVGPKRSHGTWRQILSLIKCLLEQGDPLLPAVCESKLIKVIVAGIFASTILLSNAYKSQNVYNMVVARKLLQYDNVDQLKNAQFVFHTRIEAAYYFLKRRLRSDSFYRDNGTTLPNFEWSVAEPGYMISTEHVQVVLYTEIWRIISDVGGLAGALYQLSRLADKATLSNKHLDLVRENLENQTKYPLVIHGESNQRNLKENLTRFAVEQEEKSLVDELLVGSNVAVLLPVSAGIRLKFLLRSYSKQLYAGKEKFTSGIMAFDIFGAVDLRIFKRTWAMRESGLIDWLHGLFDDTRLLHGKQYEPVAAARISGNILVIFVVWSVGNGVSLLSLSEELSWPVFKRVDLKKFLFSLSNMVSVFVSYVTMKIGKRSEPTVVVQITSVVTETQEGRVTKFNFRN